MCKILLFINDDPSPKAKRLINQVIEANTNDLMTEKSGYSVLSKDNPSYYLDYPSVPETEKRLKYRRGVIHCIHTRTATGGSVGIDGLHLQPINGYYFAHNGWTRGEYKDKSDSYHLAQKIIKPHKPLNLQRIQGVCGNAGFYGKMMLYSPDKNDLIWFNNDTAYITALSKKTLVLSSYKPSLIMDKWVCNEILGYPFWQEDGGTEIPHLYQEALNNQFLQWDLNKFTLINQSPFNCGNAYSYRTGGGIKDVYDNEEYYKRWGLDVKKY